MTLLARIRSPSARAIRNAGPPTAWSAAAVAIAALLVVVLWLAVAQGEAGPVLALVPVLTTALAAGADRDGWLVRSAMIWTALEQNRRWQWGRRIPATERAAAGWLETHPDAGVLERASMHIGAGQVTQAMRLMETFEPSTDVDRVCAIRLRQTAEAHADPSRSLDLDQIEAASQALPADERRYQIASAAWSQAWLDVAARRQWRPGFAARVRPLGPFPVPARYWLAGIALQQCALPIAIGTAFFIVWGVLRL